MTFRTKTIAGFGIALAILLSVAFLSYRSIVRTDEDRLWVTHTDVVLVNINELLTNASTVDSSTRSYILTGDPSYLAVYAGAAEQVRRNLDAIT